MASAASLAIGARPPRRIDPPPVLFSAAGLASAALLLWTSGDPVFAGAFFAGLIGAAGILMLVRARPAAEPAEAAAGADLRLLRDALDSSGPSLAIGVSDGEGRVLCANRGWSAWFGADALPLALARAVPTARRDR